MLFNSHQFIFIFLPSLIFSVWIARKLGKAAATLVLVVASLFFYAQWEPVFIVLLCASIVVNYMIGTRLYDSQSLFHLWIGVTLNLIAIAYFKYRYFLAAMVVPGFDAASHGAMIAIPLGISFFTFQQISFLVDCRRNAVKPGGLLEYAFYVSFFPQLVAGPIVRFSEVVNQFTRSSAFQVKFDNASIGLTMFVIGLFKKAVIADQMALIANPVFEIAETNASVSFAEAWVGVLAYTLQIYFDFSGYSDMALGLGRIFGIRLPLNFNSPYKAASIIDFWRQWHITLSRFLRDYLYFPLGGNRHGKMRRYGNLMVVMLLGGLWHGAGWNFVLWGGLHGLALTVNHLYQAVRGEPGRSRRTASGFVCGWLATFLVVVVGWVLFRSQTLGGAANIYQGMMGLDDRLVLPDAALGPLGAMGLWLQSIGVAFEAWGADRAAVNGKHVLWIVGGFVICLLFPNTQTWMNRYQPAIEPNRHGLARIPRILAWRPTIAWSAVTVAIFLYATFSAGDTSEFIYWQF